MPASAAPPPLTLALDPPSRAPPAPVGTGARSPRGLGPLPARVFLLLIRSSVVGCALPTVGSVKSVWPVVAGLVLFVIGAVIMAQAHPDPFPLGRGLIVLGLGLAITVLVDWNLPGIGRAPV